MNKSGWLTSALTGATMLASGAVAQDLVSTDGYADAVADRLDSGCEQVIDAACIAQTLDEVVSFKKSFGYYLNASAHPSKQEAQVAVDANNCNNYIKSASDNAGSDIRKSWSIALDAYVSCLYNIDEAAKIIDVKFEPETAKLLDNQVACMRRWDPCPADLTFKTLEY